MTERRSARIRGGPANDSPCINCFQLLEFLAVDTAGGETVMRSLATNAGHRRHRASGFSLIEMLTVVALIIVLASISFISFVPVMKQQRVSNAYNTTLSPMRQARDNALSQRTPSSATFPT